MIYDLHTHSTASDGKLSPDELLAFAIENKVEALAITDHDTLEAYPNISDMRASELHVIPGVELSTTWAGRGVHIVGLNIDLNSSRMRDGIERQQSARLRRAKKIADRLQRFGACNVLESVIEIAGKSVIGRPHFAQCLVDQGLVKDQRTAYRKYLGTGKPGDVKDEWASMTEVIEWIRAAGGVAVLAHPAKYRMTNSKLTELLQEFKSLGGTAMEVVSGHQTINVTEKLARLAMDIGLAASCGSDFHDPAQTWSLPGRFASMPGKLPRVWDQW